MSKSKTVFVCRNCGAESPKWIGRCPSCHEWNSYVEEVITRGKAVDLPFAPRQGARPVAVGEIKSDPERRMLTGIGELDRLLGGGIVKGSVILLGGEPGIGKSTLALQLALRLNGRTVLYVSGEESEQQISMRSGRLAGGNNSCFILSETDIAAVLTHAGQINPSVIIIDSVQTITTGLLDSPAGSITQVRECAAMLLRYAKTTGVPVILIGHITKDGTLAGPKVLEHIVDVVLLFEGDGNFIYRLLRPVKNRFGSTSELGIFEMLESGLREVTNPSELFINKHDEALSGIAIAATIDGIRPFMIETQALVSSAVYGTPQRSSTGFDVRRLNMLLAVLEKRAGFRLATRDVFLNITGGIRVNDPAIDLAVIVAVLSSNLDIPVPEETCFAGEVGLSGEIRPVPRIEQRIREASKLGFGRIVISKYHKTANLPKEGTEIIRIGKIADLVKILFS
ncbi:MAG: DNA repair protein RadA [Bacteroidales bacterium]|jgi:DNA repair protein RadA/Sms|nr:DNA repair protein RadA [Bacteroidales bacterium]